MNIRVEKIDTHEGVIIKVLLNSGATGMFMDCHDGDTVMRTVRASRVCMDLSAHHQPFRNPPNYLNNCQLL